MFFYSEINLGITILIFIVSILIAFVLCHLFGCLCKNIAYSKNRDGEGYYWLGFWTFPVGLIIVASLPSVQIKKYKKENSDSRMKSDSFVLNSTEIKFIIDGYKSMYEKDLITYEMYNKQLSKFNRLKVINNNPATKISTNTQKKYSIKMICEDELMSVEEKRILLRTMLNNKEISSAEYSQIMDKLRKNTQ